MNALALLLAIEPVACHERVYDAVVLDVIDGDTFWAMVEVGMGIHYRVKIRAAHADAPETRGKNKDPIRGPKAEEFTRAWLAEYGNVVYIVNDKPGKYNRRRIAEVYRPGSSESWSEALHRTGNVR